MLDAELPERFRLPAVGWDGGGMDESWASKVTSELALSRDAGSSGTGSSAILTLENMMFGPASFVKIGLRRR